MKYASKVLDFRLSLQMQKKTNVEFLYDFIGRFI